MLGVFREVAIKINKHEIGKLATFDLMFEGISISLKSQISRAINIADKNIDNKFAVKLLKVLFLVKYIKEFKSTIRNLMVLMLEDFNQNQLVLRKNIEEALNLLEQQTYIQRSGEIYEFLTDEEQDTIIAALEDIKNEIAEATLVVSAAYEDISYADTTDPGLTDARRLDLGVNARLDLSPTTRLTLGLGRSDSEQGYFLYCELLLFLKIRSRGGLSARLGGVFRQNL